MTPKQIQQATIAALKARGVEVDPKITITDLVPIVERLTGIRRHYTNPRSQYLETWLQPPRTTGRYTRPFRPMVSLPEDLGRQVDRLVGMPRIISMATRVPG